MVNKTTLSLICFLSGLSQLIFGQVVFLPNTEFAVTKNSQVMQMPWCGGFNAPQFSRVDLNLDGKEDLIAFDRADKQVTPLINMGGTGQVSYKYAPVYKQKFPTSVGWMLMRDFNNDGKKDAFYCHSYGAVSLSTNVSTSSLEFQNYSTSIDGPQYPGGIIPFYVPSSDIPAIYDVNGDGDIDILTFGVLGVTVEYIKNQSIERTGNSDSLDFELRNYCWGHFLETGIQTNKLTLFDTCNYNVPGAEIGINRNSPTGSSRPLGGSNRHAGSTITAFDNNGDSVADLLLGDVSFNNLVMAQNGGTLPDQNSSVTSQDTAYPSYDVSVDVMLFPASYIEDVDNDGLNDLIVAPNTTELAENYDQIWFYKNIGTNKIPNFSFQRKNLFENQYIDLGDKAIPEFFDYNGDGLMDIIVSNYGYFDRDSIVYECKLSLYENTGTQAAPSFEFITDNYHSLDTLNLGKSLEPTFGDIDGDGDQDMILGNSEGYLHLFTNTAGAGNVASFSLTSSRLQSNLGDTIDVGQFSSPQLFDYDNDSDLDLIIGKMNGGIRYYENIGNPASYNFKKITDSMGRVEIHEIWDIYGASTGYATPKFYRESGVTTMYCGSQTGGIFKFTGINTANPRQTFIIDTVLDNYMYGLFSSPTLYDFKGDGRLDLLTGNLKGGLTFFTEGNGTLTIKEIKPSLDFQLYPNPANEFVTIKTNEFESQTRIMISDMLGKTVKEIKTNSIHTQVDIADLKKGVYFVSVIGQNGLKTRKLVVQ